MSHMAIWIVTGVFLSMTGCSNKYVVLSSDYAYHIKSDRVYRMKIDTSLFVYDQFKSIQPRTEKRAERKPVLLQPYNIKLDLTPHQK